MHPPSSPLDNSCLHHHDAHTPEHCIDKLLARVFTIFLEILRDVLAHRAVIRDGGQRATSAVVERDPRCLHQVQQNVDCTQGGAGLIKAPLTAELGTMVSPPPTP